MYQALNIDRVLNEVLPSVIIVVVLLHNFGQRSTAVEGEDPIPEPHQARPKPEVVGIAERLPDVLKSQIRVKLVFGKFIVNGAPSELEGGTGPVAFCSIQK